MSGKIDFSDRMLSLGLARVSEAAAQVAEVDLLCFAKLGRPGQDKTVEGGSIEVIRHVLELIEDALLVRDGVGGDVDVVEVLLLLFCFDSSHIPCLFNIVYINDCVRS